MHPRQQPSVVVDPAIAPLITEQIAEIRDVVVDRACKVARTLNVRVERVHIREYAAPYESDRTKFVFDISVSTDDETGHSYWGSVAKAVQGDKDKLSKQAQTVLQDISVFVKW